MENKNPSQQLVRAVLKRGMNELPECLDAQLRKLMELPHDTHEQLIVKGGRMAAVLMLITESDKNSSLFNSGMDMESSTIMDTFGNAMKEHFSKKE